MDWSGRGFRAHARVWWGLTRALSACFLGAAGGSLLTGSRPAYHYPLITTRLSLLAYRYPLIVTRLSSLAYHDPPSLYSPIFTREARLTNEYL
jgi:hypothetical protein